MTERYRLEYRGAASTQIPNALCRRKNQVNDSMKILLVLALALLTRPYSMVKAVVTATNRTRHR